MRQQAPQAEQATWVAQRQTSELRSPVFVRCSTTQSASLSETGFAGFNWLKGFMKRHEAKEETQKQVSEDIRKLFQPEEFLFNLRVVSNATMRCARARALKLPRGTTKQDDGTPPPAVLTMLRLVDVKDTVLTHFSFLVFAVGTSRDPLPMNDFPEEDKLGGIVSREEYVHTCFSRLLTSLTAAEAAGVTAIDTGDVRSWLEAKKSLFTPPPSTKESRNDVYI